MTTQPPLTPKDRAFTIFILLMLLAMLALLSHECKAQTNPRENSAVNCIWIPQSDTVIAKVLVIENDEHLLQVYKNVQVVQFYETLKCDPVTFTTGAANVRNRRIYYKGREVIPYFFQ